MNEKKDTYVYELIRTYNELGYRDPKVVYVGITKNLKQREQAHRADVEKKFDKFHTLSGPFTREVAEKIEIIMIEGYCKNHSGDKPEYNREPDC